MQIQVCLWDVKRREKQGQVVGGAAGAPPGAAGARCAVRAIAFSPGGERLAYSHSDDWSRGEAGCAPRQYSRKYSSMISSKHAARSQ